MNKEEARRILTRFQRNDNQTEQDEFMAIEAANYLVEVENDPDAMCFLGGLYYGKQKYDLAEKYYLLADENGDDYAPVGLGFIYYYGRNGAKDFKKAFYYFNKAKNLGDMEAAMKIADMYHNGYGCEKDDVKYKETLLEIYDKIKDSKKLFDPYPEVAHRLADIYINENTNLDEARMMLSKARSFIIQRIRYSPFWGNFIVCRRVITLYYKLFPFEEDNMDSFDLFYLFTKPHKVSFVYHNKDYIIESFFDEGQMRVKCDNIVYKSTEDFLTNAKFNGKHIYIIEYDGDYHYFQIIG